MFKFINSNCFQPGLALAEWCSLHQPRLYNVDERRLVQFGVNFEFIRVARAYAYIEERVPRLDAARFTST